MLHDLNAGKVHDDDDLFDVCIAGAGMAGITIALELAAKGHRVLIVEGGGLEYESQSQDLYRGDILGRAYFDLDVTRLRFLGGTSNHWEGWCRPLDDIDFQVHPQIPLSGWPIDRSDLQPYQRRVCDVLEIDDDFADIDLPSQSESVKRIAFRFSDPPVRFGEKYLPQLQSNKNITLYVNANLADIRIDEGNGTVTRIDVAGYRDPTLRHVYRARYFVLALGGIENPRMMLASRTQMPAGIGNLNGLVGRCFSEHFHVFGGYYAATDDAWPFQDTEVYLAPRPTFQTERQIANASVRLAPLDVDLGKFGKETVREAVCYSDLVADFLRVFREVDCNIRPKSGGYARVVTEQVPNLQSRVKLSDRTDALGLPVVALDWQSVDVDRRTIVETVAEVARYLARSKFGNIKLADWILKDEALPDVAECRWVGAGSHHMATTRMSSSPQAGVVDKDLRVFGHDNLFVAGSSVFPTVGHANPSFTLLQLALRLSDHLDRLLVR